MSCFGVQRDALVGLSFEMLGATGVYSRLCDTGRDLVLIIAQHGPAVVQLACVLQLSLQIVSLNDSADWTDQVCGRGNNGWVCR